MNEYEKYGKELIDYCEKYKVPLDHIFEILNDQKVVPMIRGKATEFNAYILLKKKLNENEWSIQKLNLNAQPDTYDEDVSVTHKRTGVILKVECKNAVRGSMNLGIKSRIIKEPHCKVKCHRSRSNIKLAKKGGPNDRYSVDSFDIILTNLSNAIIQGSTYGENFELLDDKELIDILSKHYKVGNDLKSIFDATSEDWRFAKTKEIAEKGYIPRTPYLKLDNDLHWKSIDKLEVDLHELVKDKMNEYKKKKSRSRK